MKNQPLPLAAIAGLLAAAALVHALVLSERRSRQQIGIFKSIGFTSRQVSASMVWHASLFVVPPWDRPTGRPGGGAADVDDNHGRPWGSKSEPVLPLFALVVISAMVFVTATLAGVGPAWSVW